MASGRPGRDVGVRRQKSDAQLGGGSGVRLSLSIAFSPSGIRRPLQVDGDIGKLYLSLGGVVQQKVGTFRQARTRPSAYLPLIIWGNGRGCGTRVRTRLSWC